MYTFEQYIELSKARMHEYPAWGAGQAYFNTEPDWCNGDTARLERVGRKLLRVRIPYLVNT